jgi:hypothetical protein
MKLDLAEQRAHARRSSVSPPSDTPNPPSSHDLEYASKSAALLEWARHNPDISATIE